MFVLRIGGGDGIGRGRKRRCLCRGTPSRVPVIVMIGEGNRGMRRNVRRGRIRFRHERIPCARANERTNDRSINGSVTSATSSSAQPFVSSLAPGRIRSFQGECFFSVDMSPQLGFVTFQRCFPRSPIDGVSVLAELDTEGEGG